MKSLVFLVSHIIDKAIISEYKKLCKVKNIDCILVLDNEALKIKTDSLVCEKEFFGTKIKCLFFDAELNKEFKLPCYHYRTKTDDFGKVMWHNADYRYYYVKKYFPDYDYYWSFDFDVFCNGDSYQPFFDKYSKYEEELLILEYRKEEINGKWCHANNIEWAYKNMDIYGSLFPICKLSNISIDYLYKRRLELGKIYENIEDKSKSVWPFSELFVPTELTNAGYKFASIDEPQITPDKEYDLNEDRFFEHPDNKIYHPVKGQFIERIKKLTKEKNTLIDEQEKMYEVKEKYVLENEKLKGKNKKLAEENKKLKNKIKQINLQNSQLQTKISKLERFKINILGIKISHKYKIK